MRLTAGIVDEKKMKTIAVLMTSQKTSRLVPLVLRKAMAEVAMPRCGRPVPL